MRSKIVTFLVCFCALFFLHTAAYSQQAFQVSFGGNGDDVAYDVVDAGYDQFYVLSTTRSYGLGGSDILISKMDVQGNLIWSKTYGAAGDEVVRKASKTSDGGLVLTGQTKSFAHQEGDILCMKINADGSVAWVRKFGNDSIYPDLGTEIIETSDGGYAMAGIVNVAGGVADALVMKLDKNGNTTWAKIFNRGDGEDGVGIIEEGNTLVTTADLQHGDAGEYTIAITKLNTTDGSVISANEIALQARGLFNPYIFKAKGGGYWISAHQIDHVSYGKMQQTFLRLNSGFVVTQLYKLTAETYTNNYFTGFQPLDDNSFISCASPQANGSGYFYHIGGDFSIKSVKKTTGTTQRQLNRLQLIGNTIICVGADKTNNNDDVFVTGFSSNGNTGNVCGFDTSLITLSHQLFAPLKALTWPIIQDMPFGNTNILFVPKDVTPNTNNLCNTTTTVVPSFTLPDSVCVNSPVNIKNTTTGATSYFWNFCVADINTATPIAKNLGNPNGVVHRPVFIDVAYQNGNYYGFLINNGVVNGAISKLIRLDFGSSLLNTPTAKDLGNFKIPNSGEGIQVIYDNNKWYAIIVGGSKTIPSTPSILKLDFGTDITNISPVVTNWGNIGKLAQPIDLYVFKQGTNWYGLTVNAENNTITRFNFTNSFENTPTADNLGNIGNLNYPTGVYAINDNGFWRVFVANGANYFTGDGATLTRLDFGNSLLNTPTGVNLGNPGSLLHEPRDITLIKLCGEIVGLAVNGYSNDIVKLNFNGDLQSTPTATSFGTLGNLSFPHSLSQIFRVGSDLYSFIPNVNGDNITRIQFAGCNNASTPNSSAQNPPAVTYSTPGVYNINLTVDDGLPTQNSICKQVVVLAGPTLKLNKDTTICIGDTAHLSASGAASYKWLPTSTLSSPNSASTDATPAATTTYVVTGKNSFGCAAKDSVRITVNTNCTTGDCDANPDFSFQQDVCDPKTILFHNETTDVATVAWDFGNGKKEGNNLNPSIVYSSFGTYPVTLIVKTNAGCIDTITKNISVNFTQDSLIITNDTLLCNAGAFTLRAVPGLTYCWSPAAGLSATNVANPTATISKNITYYLSEQSTGKNLIVNGDFNQGNTGFVSGYNYAPQNTTEGQYYVGNNPKAWNGATSQCVEHSGNNDNMMLVNGNPVAGLKVWSETIGIQPNTNYAFSCWVQAIYPINPAQLQFYINGKELGTVFTADPTPCNWKQFFITWNSGANTKADISIINQNTAVHGNDFALDDISFAETFIKHDSINVKLGATSVEVSADTSVCTGGSVKLSATAPPGSTYNWLPAASLDNAGIATPTASPASTTTYHVQVKAGNGCTVNDSVKVSVLKQPAIATLADTTICSGTSIQLVTTAVDAVSYKWSPAASLSDPYVINPVASPTANTQYIVTANPGTQCTAKDTVNIFIRASPTVTASADTTLCSGTSVQLSASSPGNVTYSWSPSTGLDDASIASPIASPGNTTVYVVRVNDASTCAGTDTVTVSVIPQPTVATRGDTTICSGTGIPLFTTAANGNTYSWSPASGLSDASSLTPTASPASNTQYIITVNPGTLCVAKDTVNIAVNISPTVQATGDSTLCAGASEQLFATSPGNVTYQWTPAIGLNDPTVPNPVATPAATTKYYIQVADNNQCTGKDSVLVQVIPQPVFAVNPPQTIICEGQKLLLTASGGDIYQWSPTATVTSPNSAATQVFPTATTNYQVIIYNSVCKLTDTVFSTVEVNAKLVATLHKSNDIDCNNLQTNLVADGGNQYTWSPAAGLSNTHIPNPVAAPLETTTYHVTIKNANGCVAEDTVQVKVTKGDLQINYRVISAFTPNGDGVNDCFGLKFWGGVTNLRFEVYNRWGNKIFSTSEPSACWDGTYKGVPQPPGTYVYQISATTICGNVYRKGTVVLIR